MNRQPQNLFAQSVDLYSEYIQEDIINRHLQSYRIQHDKAIFFGDDATAIFLTLFSSHDNHLHLRFSALDFPVYKNTIELSEEATLLTTLIALDKDQSTIDINTNKMTTIHLFVRKNEKHSFVYVGHLLEIKPLFTQRKTVIRYIVERNLPDTIIKQLLGFEWFVYEPIEILMESSPNLSTFDPQMALEFAKQLLQQYGQYGDMRIVRFDKQDLGIHIINERSYVDYRTSIKGFIIAKDPLVMDSDVILDDPYGDVFDTIKLSSTIPTEDAIKALHEFVETGQRPTCIEWRE